jgi:hypothetical protein
MEDGTRGKNNRENISIAIRYVKNGKVFESLLGIYTTKELDAKNFTDLTLDIMEKKQFRYFASSESCCRGSPRKKPNVTQLTLSACSRSSGASTASGNPGAD